MKILIDIGHPAHVHYFRNLARYCIDNGSEVLFTTRDKEVTIQLLQYYQLPFISFGRPFKSRVGKAWGMFWFTLRLLWVSLRFKPEFYLNATQYSAIVAWLLRKPHIALEDTFNMEQVRLYMPFTSAVLTGDYPHPALGKKEIHYSGYQELAYLHPKRFTPDHSVIDELGVRKAEKYVIVRFISWSASHDFGSPRPSLEQKVSLIETLEKITKVFISAENKLPETLEKYRLQIPPQKIHNVLAFASLYIGEGATMASECAMLGTPAIYVNPQNVYSIRDQEEKYGLVYSFQNYKGVLEKAKELLINPTLKEEHIVRKERMLAEKIDLTSLLIWFIENYPDSTSKLRNDPKLRNSLL